MANPVNNNGINAKVDVGGVVKVDLKIGGTARVSENQGKGIFQSVNDNYTKNPNRFAAHCFRLSLCLVPCALFLVSCAFGAIPP